MDEFVEMLRTIGLYPSKAEARHLFDQCDPDKSGAVSLQTLRERLGRVRRVHKPEPRPVQCARRVLRFYARTWVQTILYVAYVTVIMMLAESMRMKEEYTLDTWISDTLIHAHTDAPAGGASSSFENIRRVADIYEWGERVLWPGLLGNYAVDEPTVQEVLDQFNADDWSEGMMIRQNRVKPTKADACGVELLGANGVCLSELDRWTGTQDTAPFGYNWTHPDEPISNPFLFHSASWLGTDPDGQASADPASLRVTPAGGYVTIILPFFSDVFLPEQRGKYNEIDRDAFEKHRVIPPPLRSVLGKGDNKADRVARYFCVRLSWNTEQIHQICDPNDANNRTTGVVRMAIEEFWNDLKRAHYIDEHTRSVTITMAVSSNNLGVRSRATMLFETPSTGSVLPSHDMETRVTNDDRRQNTRVLVWVAFGFTLFFCVLEGFEALDSGLVEYFCDMWNLMDWLNFSIFFLVWHTLITMFWQEDNRTCSHLCEEVGYYDDYLVMGTVRDAKIYLSLCVCIQLLKIIKFANALVPKMSLATSVLSKALMDLIFFGTVFGISLFAFSNMFYVQLGPVMMGYNDQISSFISLARALFGDFDIDDIMNNAPGGPYMSAVLFLLYLFVAVFILLTVFIAILVEAQGAVRIDQHEARARAEAGDGSVEHEYGVFHTAASAARVCWSKIPVVRRKVGMSDLKEAVKTAEDEIGDTSIEEQILSAEDQQAHTLDKICSQMSNLSQRVEEVLRLNKLAERQSQLEPLLPQLTQSIVQNLGPKLTNSIATQLRRSSSNGDATRTHRHVLKSLDDDLRLVQEELSRSGAPREASGPTRPRPRSATQPALATHPALATPRPRRAASQPMPPGWLSCADTPDGDDMRVRQAVQIDYTGLNV